MTAQSFTYYLGARPNWLDAPDLVDPDVPLFVSAATLARYKTRGDEFPLRRWGSWALDSGAYTALIKDDPDHPCSWSPDEYGGMVLRLMDDLGMPDFVAPQDMPCEPGVLRKTRLDARTHVELTVENYLFLAEEFPWVPWCPVLQGWEPDDYLYCEQLYLAAGVDLAGAVRVGVGSICRRGHVPAIVDVVSQFEQRGYALHGFGLKITALPVIGHLLRSADSYAWSDTARLDRYMMPGCDHRSRITGEPTDCRNCPRWAQAWRERVLDMMPAGRLALVA